MPSERVQRRIDRLLDQAEEAADRQDWDTVRRIAAEVLGLDPENEDAPALVRAADNVRDAEPGPGATGGTPPPGEGGKKLVDLAHDELLDREVAIALIKTEGPRLAAELLSDWIGADLDAKRQMLEEQRDELLSADVADVLQGLIEQDPEDGALVVHHTLLDLAAAGRHEGALEALAAPERFAQLLDDLARSGDWPQHGAIATLAVTAAADDATSGLAWFHYAISLAVDDAPDDALSAIEGAREQAPDQLPSWITLLDELEPAHPELRAPRERLKSAGAEVAE